MSILRVFDWFLLFLFIFQSFDRFERAVHHEFGRGEVFLLKRGYSWNIPLSIIFTFCLHHFDLVYGPFNRWLFTESVKLGIPLDRVFVDSAHRVGREGLLGSLMLFQDCALIHFKWHLDALLLLRSFLRAPAFPFLFWNEISDVWITVKVSHRGSVHIFAAQGPVCLTSLESLTADYARLIIARSCRIDTWLRQIKVLHVFPVTSCAQGLTLQHHLVHFNWFFITIHVWKQVTSTLLRVVDQSLWGWWRAHAVGIVLGLTSEHFTCFVIALAQHVRQSMSHWDLVLLSFQLR